MIDLLKSRKLMNLPVIQRNKKKTKRYIANDKLIIYNTFLLYCTKEKKVKYSLRAISNVLHIFVRLKKESNY